MHLLEMFNYCKSEKAMDELKEVLSDFYAKKAQEETDRLWEDGALGEEAIEALLSEHSRTPLYIGMTRTVCSQRKIYCPVRDLLLPNWAVNFL